MTTLTEQWDKGELPEGDYYIKRRNGLLLYDNIDSRGVWRNSIDEDIVEVLAQVPSYDEWLEKTKSLKVLAEAYCKEKQQNKQLKELLKECVKMNTRLENALWQWNEESELYDENEVLENKINEVLK